MLLGVFPAIYLYTTLSFLRFKIYYSAIMIFSFVRFMVFFVLVLETSTFVNAFSNNFTDHQALLSVKASIKSDPLSVLSSWNNSIHFCQWKGITCNHLRQRVTALNLSSQHLMGTLSPHIGNLSFLKAIYLHRNNFQGSIPNEIGRLFRLQHLYLGNNSFQGEFPSNLSHCTELRNISMPGNNLQGKLPSEFASWSKLYRFSLGNNHFTGSIPPSIGNMSSIRSLYLSSNNLEGHIPLEVAYLAELEILGLALNKLWGMLPLQLYNISSLYSVDLTINEFEGTLPPDLGFTLPNIQRFYTGGNRFSGPFPPSISNASKLVIFDIGQNNITGPVQIKMGSLPDIQILNLGGNLLGDNQPSDDLSFFDSLVNCTRLKLLDLSENRLRGVLPNSVVNLSTTIEMLDLSANQIQGSIPQEIGKLVNMTRLNLNDNFLTGTIPKSIGKLSKLGVLTLGENNISGVIPNSISNITQLSVLSLQSNMLQGSIPTGLLTISTLQKLYLTNNGLGGVIPEQLVQLSPQCAFLYLDQNLFTGQLPSNIGSLNQLVHLYVSNNKLTGDIPTTLGNCVMLEQLGMEGNLFEGRIPTSLKALKSLAFLDLSNNNMSGTIPSFLKEFHLIVFLNLSHNNIEGEVPKHGLFSNFSRFSVDGNLRLCGGIQALHLHACPNRNKKKAIFPRIVLVLFLPLAVFLACLAFIIYRHRKSKRMNNVHVPVLQDNRYPRISYQDLQLATEEFSLNNLLGMGRYGSVYKGTLKALEQVVAVKVLNVEIRGANKSFLAECETLRNIRHRNLIKIITACSSTDFKGNDFKALVFEFMTNGSLDNWLHSSPSSYQGNERSLTLLQRLNISIDVAQGVDYLHHHSHTSIIHCDIKPSNVLLDEEFVAHVGDFGLAKFSFATESNINQAQTSSTGLGTFGYIPPEYGLGGEVSASGDVYSYGILLLEMFTGKQPTCSSILLDNACNLHDYVRKALPQRVMDIADPRIVIDQEEEDRSFTMEQSYSKAVMEVCLTSIFEVGILCSVEIPKERMEISVAIKHLHLARDKLLQHGQSPR